MTLSYLGFLAAVALPPLATLVLLLRNAGRGIDRTLLTGIAVLAVVALAYTIPWDNHLVATGVWAYADGSVLLRLPHTPVEEYLFVVLQTVVAGLWVGALPDSGQSLDADASDRLIGALAGTLVGAIGIVLLGTATTYYLGAILTWAGPVLALQWGVGWPALWRDRWVVVAGTLVPASYFAVADRVAIELGLWRFSSDYTVGRSVLGLPVEEAVFFLLTTLFVVQGLLLFEWVVKPWH